MIISTENLMVILGIEGSMAWPAMANGVQSHRHLLRRDEEHALRKVLMFEVNGPLK